MKKNRQQLCSAVIELVVFGLLYPESEAEAMAQKVVTLLCPEQKQSQIPPGALVAMNPKFLK